MLYVSPIRNFIADTPREASVMFHLLYPRTSMIGWTFERVKKYDENENAGNIGIPYSIKVCETPRWINLYAVVNEYVYFSYGMRGNQFVYKFLDKLIFYTKPYR